MASIVAVKEYTEAQKKEAVKAYEEFGAAEATRRLDFHVEAGTLRVWAHRAGVKRYSQEKTAEATIAHQRRQAEMREEFRELLLARGTEMLLRMDEPTIDYRGKDAKMVTFDRPNPRECQALMTAAVIALQNFRLEMGEATARTITEGADDIDRSVVQLVAEMARRGEAETS